MNRTKKFFYNSLSSAILQIVTMLIGFILPRIMLQYYGSEINGLVSSITQFISYFNLVEAGLAGAAIYALYKPLADEDHKAINGVVSAAKHFYTQSGYIFISLTLGLSIIYPIFVRSNALSPLYVGLLVLILGVNGTLEFFTLAKYRVLLSADQKTYVISLASITQMILNTAIIIALATLQVNIVVIRTVALLSIFLRSFILMVYVNRKYKYINYKVEPNNKALDKRWDALYLQILGATQIGAPVFLTTIFTSLQMVSVYSIYNMVIGGINGLLSIFISGLSASFGDIIARGEIKTLQKSYQEFEFSYYTLITIVYSIAMVTIMPFIRIYTKGVVDINYDLPVLGILFVLNGWLYNIKTPQGMLVISAGMYKETKIQSTIQAVIIVIVGAVLSPRFGLLGIMIASCMSNLYRDIDLLFFIPKNITRLPVKNSAFRILKMIIEMLMIWIPFQCMQIQALNFIQWFLYAIVVGIYAIVVVGFMSTVFDKALLKGVIVRLKSMLIRS